MCIDWANMLAIRACYTSQRIISQGSRSLPYVLQLIHTPHYSWCCWLFLSLAESCAATFYWKQCIQVWKQLFNSNLFIWQVHSGSGLQACWSLARLLRIECYADMKINQVQRIKNNLTPQHEPQPSLRNACGYFCTHSKLLEMSAAITDLPFLFPFLHSGLHNKEHSHLHHQFAHSHFTHTHTHTHTHSLSLSLSLSLFSV
jgi:hypothetical protein